MLGNWLKTATLLAGLTALFGVLGMAFGGVAGMLIMLLLAGAVNLWAWWQSDKLVLRMHHAQPVDSRSGAPLYRMVAELAQKAGLPMPAVYLIHSAQPNAFATGRDPQHAAVAVTSGLLQLLSERELRGVLAHELAHILHRDTLLSTLTATIAGAVSNLSQFLLFFGGSGGREDDRPIHPLLALIIALFAPLAAMLIQMAISRAREFEADRVGAQLSGDPQALASALQRIERYAQGYVMPSAEQHPETAQMMIINPLHGRGLAGLFRTHPDTEERVARLLAMLRPSASSGW